MYNLSGFINISQFMSNDPGVIAKIGECSPEGLTYSTEVGYYRDTTNTYPAVELLTFSSKRDDALVKVDDIYVSIALRVGQFLFNQSTAGALPTTSDGVKQQLSAEFTDVATITAVGAVLTNNQYYMPEYVYYKVVDPAVPGAEDNVVRLWFVNDSFIGQYDLYEITCVPPIAPLDFFFEDTATVLEGIAKITVESNILATSTVTAGKPYTILVSNNYSWYDPQDNTTTAPVPWTTAIYGMAGDNIDVIRETLQNWILANSTHPRADWEVIFPTLFLPTEFYIAPLWDHYSVPNKELIGGIYSPTVRYTDVLTYANRFFVNYDPDYIAQNTCVSSALYKSLCFVAIGNDHNQEAEKTFDAQWPEYALISATSPDFSRMSPDTEEFILFLNKLFKAAEELTPTSTVPQGCSRVTRGEVLYITGNFKYVEYFVPAKYNLDPSV